MNEDIRLVIARSSIGGYAWCKCLHADLTHGDDEGTCGLCDCQQLRRMTPDDWLAWKHPALIDAARHQGSDGREGDE